MPKIHVNPGKFPPGIHGRNSLHRGTLFHSDGSVIPGMTKFHLPQTKEGIPAPLEEPFWGKASYFRQPRECTANIPYPSVAKPAALCGTSSVCGDGDSMTLLCEERRHCGQYFLYTAAAKQVAAQQIMLFFHTSSSRTLRAGSLTLPHQLATQGISSLKPSFVSTFREITPSKWS